MRTVIIGCKLPHGLAFMQDGKRHVIKGLNTAIAGGYGITHMDEAVASVFFATHAEFAPVKAKAIFYHSEAASVDAMAAEYTDLKTGLEGLDQTKPAPGLAPSDDSKPDLNVAERVLARTGKKAGK